jgi:hypothetical protein
MHRTQSETGEVGPMPRRHDASIDATEDGENTAPRQRSAVRPGIRKCPAIIALLDKLRGQS